MIVADAFSAGSGCAPAAHVILSPTTTDPDGELSSRGIYPTELQLDVLHARVESTATHLCTGLHNPSHSGNTVACAHKVYPGYIPSVVAPRTQCGSHFARTPRSRARRKYRNAHGPAGRGRRAHSACGGHQQALAQGVCAQRATLSSGAPLMLPGSSLSSC